MMFVEMYNKLTCHGETGAQSRGTNEQLDRDFNKVPEASVKSSLMVWNRCLMGKWVAHRVGLQHDINKLWLRQKGLFSCCIPPSF